MELTKEQVNKRKNCLIKGHLWFGEDELKKILKDYDYYKNEDLKLFYVYNKLNASEIEQEI